MTKCENIFWINMLYEAIKLLEDYFLMLYELFPLHLPLVCSLTSPFLLFSSWFVEIVKSESQHKWASFGQNLESPEIQTWSVSFLILHMKTFEKSLTQHCVLNTSSNILNLTVLKHTKSLMLDTIFEMLFPDLKH